MKIIKNLDRIGTKVYKEVKAFKNSKAVADFREEFGEDLKATKDSIKDGLKELNKATKDSVKDGLKELRSELEKECPICGEKVPILSCYKLSDDNIVCYDCARKVPSYIKFYFSEVYTLEMVKKLREYIQYSESQLEPKFSETASFHEIHIDEDNGLFYIYRGPFEAILYSEFKNVTDFSIEFVGTEHKESFFSEKVLGEIFIRIDSAVPWYCYEFVDDGVTDVKRNMTGREARYDDPKDMKEFASRFEAARQKFSDYGSYNYSEQDQWRDYSQNEQRQTYSQEDISELQKAKLIFGFDDGDAITLDELKRRRNKFMKAFHPDKSEDKDADTRYSQKINNAYEILKKSLG